MGVDITGIDKGALLAELYNNAKVMGMGVFQAARGPAVMSYDEGRKLVAATLGGEFAHDNAMAYPDTFRRDAGKLYFDYLFGRCLKVDIGGDEAGEWGYDRDWGPGAFQRCADKARAGASPESAPPVQPSEQDKAEALRRSDEGIRIVTGGDVRLLGG